MYHSPGLRDGVSHRAAVRHSAFPQSLVQVPQEFCSGWNKFGLAQVPWFNWDYRECLPGGRPFKRFRSFRFSAALV
jgi:hypothetical protein